MFKCLTQGHKHYTILGLYLNQPGHLNLTAIMGFIVIKSSLVPRTVLSQILSKMSCWHICVINSEDFISTK